MISSHLPATNCPSCGDELDAATAAFGDHVPVSGDITICLRCGHIMAFTDDLKLRELNDAEVRDIAGNPKILAVQRARQEMKNHD